MESIFFAMAMFAFVGAVTPGPVNILATSTAAQKGLKSAMAHVLGASVAYALVVLISGLMMGELLKLLPKLEGYLKLAGSAFLLYLAWKIFRAPAEKIGASKDSSGLWSGSLAQLLNPKAWLVAGSGVSLYVIGQSNETMMLAFFTWISLVVCLVGIGVWALLGHAMSGWLNNQKRQRLFNCAMSLMLVLSVSTIWV
ncbi:LysE family translocator [Vibrio sonorensis]|uniref:LysE family translocator n=1 Tax=Vibrio sonorensis TaxID=1004316 RepID=UPI0008DA0E9C|nr:LysE family translocator [Vibrio sonorensis]